MGIITPARSIVKPPEEYSRIANAPNQPTGNNGMVCSMTADGKYWALATGTTPSMGDIAVDSMAAYVKDDNDVFTKMTITGTGKGGGISLSPDGTYLASGTNFYKRSGNTFAKITSPTQPSYTRRGSFTTDALYYAVASWMTPCVSIYKRNGDTFSLLSNTPSLNNSLSNDVSFSGDGTYLAVASEYAPFATVFKRSGDTFTELATAFDVPPDVATVSCSFSADGNYLVFGILKSSSFDNSIRLYKRQGDAFKKIETGITGIGPSAYPVLSADGKYLVIGHKAGPKLDMYKRDDDGVYNKLARSDETNDLYEIFSTSISSDCTYIAVAEYVFNNSSPLVGFKKS